MESIKKSDSPLTLISDNSAETPKFITSELAAELNKNIGSASQMQLVAGLAYSWGSAFHPNVLGIQELKSVLALDISASDEMANQFHQWSRNSLAKNLDAVDKSAYQEAIAKAEMTGEDVRMAVLHWVDQYISKYHH